MSFAPQPRALFQHLNFQKCTEPEVILTFRLRHVLHAAAACTFSRTFYFGMCFAPQPRALFQQLSCQNCSGREMFLAFWLPNLRRARKQWDLILPCGSAPAALASLLVYPPEPQIIGKTRCFATFLPFRTLWSFFLLPLSSWTLSLLWSSFYWLSLLWLFLFSDFSRNCCCMYPWVGSLTSKLPSIINQLDWLMYMHKNM